MKLLSIDPGKDHFAWAAWDFEDELRLCARVDCRPDRRSFLLKDYFEQCVIELPQVYQQRKWKGDPNALIQVAVTVGALQALVSSPDVLLVQPHRWKGSVPKNIMGKRIESKLLEKERRVLQQGVEELGVKKHDVIDAIGIGLWHLGRL